MPEHLRPDDHEGVVPDRPGGRPWMERMPPALAEVWALAGEAAAARKSPPGPEPAVAEADVEVDDDSDETGAVETDAVDAGDAVDPWERVVADVHVYWRARIRLATPGAEGRLIRVLDELAVYPKVFAPAWEVVEPVWHWEADDPMIAFGFCLEGPMAPAHAVPLARRALDYALRQALVGTPGPPPGVTELALAVELEREPTVHCDEKA